jgi:hypothetical protein
MLCRLIEVHDLGELLSHVVHVGNSLGKRWHSITCQELSLLGLQLNNLVLNECPHFSIILTSKLGAALL